MEFIIDGHKLRMLFRFNINEKEYIAYLDEDDEISASILVPNGEEFKLEAITDDAEWDLVEKEIEKRLSENE